MKTNSNNQSGFKDRAEQWNGNPRVDLTLRRANRKLKTEALLALLRRESPRFWELAEVVGQWIFIQFESRQPHGVTSALSQLGFHWNNARQLWQHPCGMFRDVAFAGDPRTKYGSYFAADVKEGV